MEVEEDYKWQYMVKEMSGKQKEEYSGDKSDFFT